MELPLDRDALKRPNLFIVGAMKGGTTIMHEFLTGHPEISSAKTKEIHYFTLFEKNGPEWYIDQFDQKSQARFHIDASPTYLDLAENEIIPRKIKAFSPNAKIIVMVRNPVERAVSHLNHLDKINKIPEIQGLSFSKFIAGDFPKDENARKIEGLLSIVRGFSFYAEKIQRYVNVFGAASVMVVHNDDLRKHGRRVMECVFGFLGLETPQGVDYSMQKYMWGTDMRSVSPAQHVELSQVYGRDYFIACQAPNVVRPESGDQAILFNQPVGARIDDVACGDDGFLFLVGGSNDPIQMFMNSDPVDMDIVSLWHSRVADRKKRLSGLGIKYIQCMIPEKLSTIGEKLHWPLDFSRSYGRRFLENLPVELGENCVDLFEFFRSSPYRDSLYLKTDSHWSHFGAFGAYQVLCGRLGISFRRDLLDRPSSKGQVMFDLGSKLPIARRELATFFKFRVESEIVEENELVTLKKQRGRENDARLDVGSYIRFSNERAPVLKRVLLFGDSFSEYRDHLLTGLFAETFNDFAFAWTTSIDYDLVRSFAPDIVICAMTERFMTHVPDDQFNMESYVQTTLAGEAM